MSQDLIISGILNGLVIGSMYALMAVGFTLIYGILHVVNFAHGSLYMLGAYTAFLSITYLNLDPMIAVLVSFATIFMVGFIIEKSLIKPLRIRGRDLILSSILVTIGLSIVIENVMLEIFGAYPKGYETLYPGKVIIAGAIISIERIIILIASLILVAFFSIFVKYSRLGKSMRAVAMNKEAAIVAGIDITRIYSLTFAISAGLAAAAGALLLPINFAHPFVGHDPLRIMFVVVVLGGLGSVTGALLAGYILGLTQSFVTIYFGSVVHDMLAFLVLVIVLLLRPQGLLGWERARV